MIATTLYRELPLACPSCGSSEASLTYAAPVRVLVRERDVVSVRVDDEETLFTGSALCAMCGRRWRLAEEPETGLWPAWGVGP
jgi:hypothetical protein